MDRTEAAGLLGWPTCVGLAVLLLAAGGCSDGISLAGDGGDNDPVPDALAEADAAEAAEVDPDADADGDPDADVGDCVPPCPSGFDCYYGVCVPTSADADADVDVDADGGVTCVTGAECPSGICIDGRCLPVGDDADADADAGGDADAGTCAGGWLDPTSGLCWQNHYEPEWRTWSPSVAYCDSLSWGGYGPGSWHLPSVDEFRSLVRGCPDMESGGACGVTDTCRETECWTDSCDGCSYGAGPGLDGAYCPAALDRSFYVYWTSTTSGSGYPMFANLATGAVGWTGASSGNPARCVRPGP